jgi:hypothetical protein
MLVADRHKESRHHKKEMDFRKLNKNKKNSGALVRQRTIPTQQLPLVGEISTNFSG